LAAEHGKRHFAGALAMKMKSWTVLTLATLCAVATSILLTRADSSAAPNTKSKTKPKVELYDVIQIGDELKVIKCCDLANEKKRVKDENDKALKEWTRAKKKDPASAGDKPAKLAVKIRKANLKSKEDADDERDKLQEKADKKSDAKSSDKSK
jgi:hypothetical protein